MRLASLAIAFVLATGCGIAAPLTTPEGDVPNASELEGPLIVAVTQARIRPGRSSEFNDHVAAVIASAEATEGFVGHSVRLELPGDDRWTLTIWESEEALHAFAYSGAHRTAMQQAGDVVELARSARFEVQPDELPVSWDRALAVLAEEYDLESR